jgi:hypothetical protein
VSDIEVATIKKGVNRALCLWGESGTKTSVASPIVPSSATGFIGGANGSPVNAIKSIAKFVTFDAGDARTQDHQSTSAVFVLSLRPIE